MRLGVLGGTFNPVHHGHLRLAEEAICRFALDVVWLVLSAIPPHKDCSNIVDSCIRWKFLNLACSGNPRLIPCDLEMVRPGTSYTVDTLALIREKVKSEDEIFLIVGMDAAAEMHTWKSWRKILETVNVVVARRTESMNPPLLPEVAAGVQIFDIPLLEISSSQIRQRVALGESIRYLVPESVREAIFGQGVYSRKGLSGPILEQPMNNCEAVP